MNPRQRLLVLLGACAGLAACGDPNVPSSVFSHSTGFSITLPPEWKTQADPAPGLVLMATSETMAATLKISVQPRPARLDWDEVRQTTRKLAGSGVIETFEDGTSGGHKSIFMISKAGVAGGKAMLTLTCTVAAPERLYTIVLSTRDELRAEYMHHFRAIIESFKTSQ